MISGKRGKCLIFEEINTLHTKSYNLWTTWAIFAWCFRDSDERKGFKDGYKLTPNFNGKTKNIFKNKILKKYKI